jgi:hypothetical protein
LVLVFGYRRSTDVGLGVSEVIVGADGRASGVTAILGPEATLAPAAFWATTDTKYCVPLVSPEIEQAATSLVQDETTVVEVDVAYALAT